jgi:dTMP kinase
VTSLPHARGLFVTFEGVEGAGKTTRSAALSSSLAALGIEAVHTREPGGPPLAERIRDVLLDPSLEVPARAELMLYLASRAANVELVVEPALARGAVVVCERFDDATVAYQAYGRGLDPERVRAACAFATGGLEPDLTILLDLDPEAGMARLATRRGGCDRIEMESLAFHRRVRGGYLEIAGSSPRCVVLDASLPGGELDARILDIVTRAVGGPAGRHAGRP